MINPPGIRRRYRGNGRIRFGEFAGGLVLRRIDQSSPSRKTTCGEPFPSPTKIRSPFCCRRDAAGSVPCRIRLITVPVSAFHTTNGAVFARADQDGRRSG